MAYSLWADGNPPAECPHGHDWTRPGSYLMGFFPCGCGPAMETWVAKGSKGPSGHYYARCQSVTGGERCPSEFCQPRHELVR